MRLRRLNPLRNAAQIISVIFVAGCMSTDTTPKGAVEVNSMAFSQGNLPADVNPSIVQIPDADFEPPKVETTDATMDVANGNKVTTQKTELVSTAPDGNTMTQKLPFMHINSWQGTMRSDSQYTGYLSPIPFPLTTDL